MITPQTVKVLEGEGMPIPLGHDQDLLNMNIKPLGQLPRGDLYVKFDIHFPTEINIEDKNAIANLLRENDKENG